MSWDSTWEKIFSERRWSKYPEIALVRFMARNYYNKDRKNIKILVVGSGCGSNLWYLSREGFDVYGIEGSVSGVERTNERLKKNNLKAAVEVGDFTKINYPDNFFDVVVDVASIQHNEWENVKTIVKETKRVLKPEGKFFGLMVNEDKFLLQDYGTVHFFTKEEIIELFGEDVKIDYIEYSDGRIHKSWIVECQVN